MGSFLPRPQPLLVAIRTAGIGTRCSARPLWFRGRKRPRDLDALHNLGREPLTAEVASALGVTTAQVERDLRAVPLPISLDGGPDEQSELTVMDSLADDRAEDPLATAVRADTADWLQRALGLVPPPQAEVLEWRYGLRDGVPRTLDEIAVMRGVSRERIRQLEMEALKTLRAKLSRVEAPLD